METQKRAFQASYKSIIQGAEKVRPDTREFAEEHARKKVRCSYAQARDWRAEVDSRPPSSSFASVLGRHS